jgi:hypothetical protein
MFKYLDKLLLFLGIYIDNTFINDGLSYDEDYNEKNQSQDSSSYKIDIINEEENKEIEITEIIEKNINRDDNKPRNNSITDYDINYNNDTDELISMNCFCNNLTKKNISNDNDTNDDNTSSCGRCSNYINCNNSRLYIYFKRWKDGLTYKKILSLAYSFFIFIVLSSIPSIYLYDIFVNNNKSVIANASFTILQPILYLIIRDVFKSNYFQKIYNHTHNNNYKEIHYCLPNEKKLLFSILLFTIISSSISFYFHLENDNLYINDYIPKWSEYILTIIYVFNWLYGRTVISLNIHIFFYVFLKLIKDLKYTYYKINPDNLNNIISSTPVADLLQDIIAVRHNFNKAIYMLEYIYVSATICGAISIAYMIDYKLYTSSNFVAAGLYIFIQGLFITIISILEKQRQKLLILVKSTRFSEKYILRRDEICRTCIEIEDGLIDNNDNINSNFDKKYKNLNDDCKECKNIDKRLGCNNSNNIEKNSNDIACGTDDLFFDNINNNHSLILRKNISKRKSIINQKLNLKINRTKSFQIKEINKQNASIQKNVLNTFDYVKCSYEWVKSTGRTIDWMVLTKALSEEWDAFSLLGIRFDNGSAFKKGIATTSAMVTIMKYFIDYLNL